MARDEVIIRPAGERDLAGILAIKNHYIINSAAMWYEEALTEGEIQSWWAEHRGREDRPVYVAQNGMGEIVGFASLSDFRAHDGYRYTAEDSVYVLPGHEGLGLGRRLLETAIRAGAAAGLRVVTAWIDGENQRSIDFHRQLGFVLVGTMENIGVLRGERRSVTIMDLELD